MLEFSHHSAAQSRFHTSDDYAVIPRVDHMCGNVEKDQTGQNGNVDDDGLQQIVRGIHHSVYDICRNDGNLYYGRYFLWLWCLP